MQRYLNLGGNSNVTGFEINPNYIDVEFGGNAVYRYSYASAGINNVERMKSLAVEGVGLNSYIMTYCKKLYEARIK